MSCSYHSKHIVIILLQVIVQVIAYSNILICYNLNVFQGLLCRLRSHVVLFCVFIQYRMVYKLQNWYINRWRTTILSLYSLYPPAWDTGARPCTYVWTIKNSFIDQMTSEIFRQWFTCMRPTQECDVSEILVIRPLTKLLLKSYINFIVLTQNTYFNTCPWYDR